MSPHAQNENMSCVAPAGPRALISRPIVLRDAALSDSTIRRCQHVDERVRLAANGLRSLGPGVDLDVLRLVNTRGLTVAVPNGVQPVRFPSQPTFDSALAARANIPGCRLLSTVIAGRSLTPWHVRQTNAETVGAPLLPFRSGSHHLAPDEGGVAVIFPPADCARVLAELCAWINGEPSLPVVAQALIAYLQICKLHAFHDGNGRTARALLTAILNCRIVGAPDLYLPLACVIFTNAEFVSAEYRRATDARALDRFVSYGAELIGRVLDAALWVERQELGA